MHGSSFSRYGASLLAFGHLSGLYSAGRGHGRGRNARQIVVPPAPEPGISKDEITFESHPKLWRALHPLFDGRQREVSSKVTVTVKEQKAATERLQTEKTPSGNIQPATWTWQV